MRTAVVFLLLVAAGPAAAQLQPVTRVDTLGANFDVAQVGTGNLDDFDFLEGEWTFRFQNRQGDGWGPVQSGTWTSRKLADGLVEDVWTLGRGEPTLTWRSFNRSRRVWELQGLKTSRGSWDPGLAWSSGDERYVTQVFVGPGTHARMRYQRVTNDHFLWRADVSSDGGKTWIRDQWILEADRK